MLTKNVADGVHLLQNAYVNCYLIEDEDGLTLVDTGLPAMWGTIEGALEDLGRTTFDLSAIVLTHAHFDHVGCAARARQELQASIWAHPAEHYLAEHPYRYRHEKSRLRYPFRYPRGLRILTAMARAGALRVQGVTDLRSLQEGSVLEVPGRPRVIYTPGHTEGHCALHLADRGTVLTGDALVTLDPYTGYTGPQVIAGAATASTPQALASLKVLAATQAELVLPGHGDPWTGGIQAAVDHALTHHHNE
ncbi:MAG TPA: MBL fold metallo-hydrolase [Propionibacteriaceae bacterium]